MLIILPDVPIDRTTGGLIIPVESRDRRNSGVVVDGVLVYAIGQILDSGEPIREVLDSIHEGDRVAFNYRAGYEVEHQGTVYLSIDKKFILMKL